MSEQQRNPIVLEGWQVKEVTVCNIAAEPATRIEIPDKGKLIIELEEPPAKNAK